VYRGGRLQPTSLDLYLVTEYCELGDLFHYRGQLGEGEARTLLAQLLQVSGGSLLLRRRCALVAVRASRLCAPSCWRCSSGQRRPASSRPPAACAACASRPPPGPPPCPAPTQAVQYLHEHHVWHRDLKSANVLMVLANGRRLLKVADFGSARWAHGGLPTPVGRDAGLAGALGCCRGQAAVLVSGRARASTRHAAAAGCCGVRRHGGRFQQQLPQSSAAWVGCAWGVPAGLTAVGCCAGLPAPPATTLQGSSRARARARRPRRRPSSAPPCATATRCCSTSRAPATANCLRSWRVRGGLWRPVRVSVRDAGCISCVCGRGGLEGEGGGAGPAQRHAAARCTSCSWAPLHGLQCPAASAAGCGLRQAPGAPWRPPPPPCSVAEPGPARPPHPPAHGAAGVGNGFKAPLTRLVCTPCYRAPEVVMSRGGYTSSIDMWSVSAARAAPRRAISTPGSAARRPGCPARPGRQASWGDAEQTVTWRAPAAAAAAGLHHGGTAAAHGALWQRQHAAPAGGRRRGGARQQGAPARACRPPAQRLRLHTHGRR
jgi:serine/threonine protein kinase